MACSMLSTANVVAGINRASPAQATMVAPFTGLKTTAGLPTYKTTTNITSITSNGGRVQCMQKKGKYIPRVALNIVGESVIGEGPWGGDGGKIWDDGSDAGAVRKIDLTYDDCIRTIQVVYDKDGVSVEGERHGEKKGKKHIQITLDPNDFIVSASGHFGPVNIEGQKTVIKSLKLKTHKGKTFGPYGVDQGETYNTDTENGSIIGFFGRSGFVIDAIGFYIAEI